jgi:hypothetical protein
MSELKLGRYGRRLVVRRVTRDCKRCGTPFSGKMTTQPPKYCDACKWVLLQGKRDYSKRYQRSYKRKPKSNKIKYAGYDPMEKEW